MDRLDRLHIGKLTMIDALLECNKDPFKKSAVTGAYDSPKVLLNFCREVGFFEDPSFIISKNPSIQKIYDRMHKHEAKRNFISNPKNMNIITDFGKEILKKEVDKRVINFEQFI